MKNLREAYEFCRDICDSLNIPIARVITMSSKVYAHKWGQTNYNRMYNTYAITINEILLGDDCDDKSLYNTLLHELLHTAPGCMNHGATWKRYADLINKEYDMYISRVTSSEEQGIQIIKDAKYVLQCPSCKHEFNYTRMCKSVEHPSWYACGKCGRGKGTLIRIK